jgi:hypothetical protein
MDSKCAWGLRLRLTLDAQPDHHKKQLTNAKNRWLSTSGCQDAHPKKPCMTLNTLKTFNQLFSTSR